MSNFTRIEPLGNFSLEETKEVWRRRDLLIYLAKREIKGLYTATRLGIFWVLLQPLATAIVLTIVMQSFVKVPTENLPYVVVLFTGLTPWLYFANALQRASASLTNNAYLLSKVYFPRIIVLLVPIVVVLIDYFVLAAVTMVLTVVFTQRISLSWLFIIVITVIEIILVLGFSLWFSSLSVYFKDTIYILIVILTAGVFFSPVYYLPSLVPKEFLGIYRVNPMVGIINGWRWAFLGTAYDFRQLIYPTVFGLVLLISGYIVYMKVQQNVVDIL